jgi:hypothetical protein
MILFQYANSLFVSEIKISEIERMLSERMAEPWAPKGGLLLRDPAVTRGLLYGKVSEHSSASKVKPIR